MTINFTRVSEFLKKAAATVSTFALVSTSFAGLLVMPATAVAVGSPHTATIGIALLNGNDPSTYSNSCPGTNPLESPVTGSGSGTVTLPLGSGPEKYHVSIDWGDGSPVEVATSNFTVLPSGDYDFTFSFGPHNFPETAVSGITATVYHQNDNGHDSADATSLPITVCVTPPPPVTYTLTYTAGANGSVTGTSPQTVNSGANGSAVTAVPNSGYHFVDWSDASTANPRTDTNVTANVSVTANFAVNPVVTHTITASAGANGSISPSGTVSVVDGADQSFTITPDAGYHVADVLVDGVSVGSVTTYGFTGVTAAHTIVASFDITTHTITASTGGNGDITPSGAVSVNDGADQAFAVTPALGYHILDVIVDAVSQGAIAAYTFLNVIADHTISASFAIDTYTLTYTAGANGSITGTSPQTVNSGANGSAVTAVPSFGYHFVDWSDASTTNPRTDTNVTANVSVTANFAEDLVENTVGLCSDTVDNDSDELIDLADPDCAAFIPHLTLTKMVNNGEFGQATSTDWILTASSATTTISGVTGALAVTDAAVTPGTYAISEDGDMSHYSSWLECTTSNNVGVESITTLGGGSSTTIALGDNVHCTITNTFTQYSSDLSVTKSVNDEDGKVDVGQTLTYTITVTNTGPDAAHNVIVSDILPAGVTYVSDDSEGSYATSTGQWAVGTLDSESDTATLNIVVTVNSGTAGQTIENTASVSSASADGDQEDNAQSAAVTVNTPVTPEPPVVVPPSSGGGGGGNCAPGFVFNPTTFRCDPVGQVLGASTGQVLGESCGLYMDQHLRRGGAKNNPAQVTKLQAFLVKNGFGAFTPTGFFGPLTEASVKAFQAKYADNVLKPWNLSAPTGLAYLTTLRQVNLIECPDLMIPTPTLIPWSANPKAQ